MAPELFPDCDKQVILDEDATDDDVPSFCPEVTKETDIFAYGLVSLRVRSINIYFALWKIDFQHPLISGLTLCAHRS